MISITIISPLTAKQTTSHRSCVIVIGGGLAGISATIEAIRTGADVVLLEKNPRQVSLELANKIQFIIYSLGGNSALAYTGINVIKTQAQVTHILYL